MGNILSKEEVSSHCPSDEDWEDYKKNIDSFKKFKVPKVFDEKNKHDYVYIVLADGTENDMKNPNSYTNVAQLKKELKNNTNKNIEFYYVTGVGTYEGKGNLLDKAKAKVDAAISLSHKKRAEELYEAFSEQANLWRSKDAKANISVVEVGFSRGAGVISMFNQMVHEKGIKDTVSRVWKDGKKELTGDYLLAPGQVKQSVLFYDPVTTFMDKFNKNDLSLSSSTVSALQINAKHEYRNLFPLSDIVKGENQLQVTLPGCHTDIGGSYEKDGLALYSKNVGNKYLNKMIHTENGLLKNVKLPSKDNPSVVIHHSEEHNRLYKKLDKREVTYIDKKYQSEIPAYDNSKLSYRSMVSENITQFKKEQKLKNSKIKDKGINKNISSKGKGKFKRRLKNEVYIKDIGR